MAANSKQSGFTLIEVLIAVALMAMMFLMMNKSMDDVTTTRNRILSESDALHVLEMAFSRLFDDLNTAFLADAGFEGKNQPRVTGFLGTDKSINFSSMSGLHYIQDKPDTPEHDVGFFLRQNSDDTMSLMRRSTDRLTDKLDEGGLSFELLPGLKSMEFSYYDSNKKIWDSKWDTDSVAYAGRLPAQVKVSFVIYGQPKSPDDEEKPEFTYEWLVPIALYDQKISF